MNLSTTTGFGLAPVGFPVTYNTGWECSFIFRWPRISPGGGTNSFTKVRLYLGLAYKTPSKTLRPTKFIGLRYDTDPGTSYTLTSAGNASNGVTVYEGTITGGASNAFYGYEFTVAGFTNSGNNGTFICCGSSATAVSLLNSAGVAESHSATASSAGISDSTYHFECVQNAVDGNSVQGATFDTGIALDNDWHRFNMRSIVQGEILFSIDGGTEQMLSIGTDTWPAYGLGASTNTIDANGNDATIVGNILVDNSGIYQSAACWGTPATLSGCTGSAAVLNGTWPVQDMSGASDGSASASIYLNSTVNSAASQGSTSISLTWYNVFYPIIQLTNDSESSLSENSIQIDYFSFIYNPGFATDFAQTADPTNPRFFLGQT